MVLVSDTIHDVSPYYLRAEVENAIPNSHKLVFGDYSFFHKDSTQLFFDFSQEKLVAQNGMPVGNLGVELPFSTWVHSSIFLLFLISFIVFVFVFLREGTALKGNFKTLFTFGKAITSFRKSQVTKMEAWGEFFLLVQTVLVFSILLYSGLWNNGLSHFTAVDQLLIFIGIFVAISLLIFSKIIGYKLISFFFLRNHLNTWTGHYVRMMEILGILFFLPAIFYVYLLEIREIVLVAIIVLFLMSRIVIYVELLNIFVKNKINPFYFFVYLCGTEIAPYFLLYKGVLFPLIIAGDNII